MTKERFDADSYLPLTPAMFQVLVALADGDKHGYAVITVVRRRTNDKVQLGAGTLYAIVKRLLEGGLILECDERPDPSLDDERRRYYRLTPDGRAVAQAEARRLEEVLEQAKAKLFVKKPKHA
jgi:DNA-binding PadR family transcriptional regulator